MLKLFNSKKKLKAETPSVPTHIGIIMDGNGRWARKRGLDRTLGHKFGAETFKTIVLYARDRGIKILTVYAFSTENWKRPQSEIDHICILLSDYIGGAMGKLDEENVNIRFIGDITPFPQELQEDIKKLEKKSEKNDGIILNIAINYGGRDEIIFAVKKIVDDIENGILGKEDLDEKTISNYIYTKNQPDPDLIIRPSGEFRLSNFMLWQSAYSELWFSNILWPDFKPSDLDLAISDYNKRNRRFGGI